MGKSCEMTEVRRHSVVGATRRFHEVGPVCLESVVAFDVGLGSGCKNVRVGDPAEPRPLPNTEHRASAFRRQAVPDVWQHETSAREDALDIHRSTWPTFVQGSVNIPNEEGKLAYLERVEYTVLRNYWELFDTCAAFPLKYIHKGTLRGLGVNSVEYQRLTDKLEELLASQISQLTERRFIIPSIPRFGKYGISYKQPEVYHAEDYVYLMTAFREDVELFCVYLSRFERWHIARKEEDQQRIDNLLERMPQPRKPKPTFEEVLDEEELSYGDPLPPADTLDAAG